jgi:hypothetical protein
VVLWTSILSSTVTLIVMSPGNYTNYTCIYVLLCSHVTVVMGPDSPAALCVFKFCIVACVSQSCYYMIIFAALLRSYRLTYRWYVTILYTWEWITSNLTDCRGTSWRNSFLNRCVSLHGEDLRISC